jgi:serine phosphatase RsbU (regulator of sigma subunit)
MREPRPSGVLAQLNDAVLHQDAGERFCTAVYARVVPGTGGVSMSLACGGHPLPLVLRAEGSVEAVGRPGMLLGLFEEPDLTDTDVELGPGDAAVFFTDGATEAKRRSVLLGEDRLRAIVSTCTGLRAAEIAHRLEDAILAFQEENGPSDDLAIVVLRVPQADGA